MKRAEEKGRTEEGQGRGELDEEKGWKRKE
jgi:hypothetical protein